MKKDLKKGALVKNNHTKKLKSLLESNHKVAKKTLTNKEDK